MLAMLTASASFAKHINLVLNLNWWVGGSCEVWIRIENRAQSLSLCCCPLRNETSVEHLGEFPADRRFDRQCCGVDEWSCAFESSLCSIGNSDEPNRLYNHSSGFSHLQKQLYEKPVNHILTRLEQYVLVLRIPLRNCIGHSSIELWTLRLPSMQSTSEQSRIYILAKNRGRKVGLVV